MAPSQATARIASLGDASLSVDDLALLVPPCWMNDQLISFWCEHLRINVLQNDVRVAILPPNLSFFISLTDDYEVLSQIASANNMNNSELIILTVNDSRHADVNGNVASGTHWSLLALERRSNVAYYMDSLPLLSNVEVAQVLLHRLSKMLGTSKASFVELNTPRQKNSYDCGAFVCKFAEDVVRCFLSNELISSLYADGAELHPDHIDQKRQEIGKLACTLLNEAPEDGPRQRSPEND
ncbi:unnamed protein product [Agarophyton chilense]